LVVVMVFRLLLPRGCCSVRPAAEVVDDDALDAISAKPAREAADLG
jgi:hypothetical protein